MAARRRLLRSMLREQSVTGQQELVDLLGAAGHPVTQATVSRDLRSIGATKNRDGAYEVPDRTPAWNDDVLSRVIAGFVEEIAVSGNIVVLKAGPEVEVLSKNDLGDSLIATPAIANDRLYVRTLHKLFCFAEEK